MIFAEFSVQAISVCFWTFNIVSYEDNFTLGYGTCGLIGAYVFVCLVVILSGVIISARTKLRIWKAKRSFNRRRKQLKINL